MCSVGTDVSAIASVEASGLLRPARQRRDRWVLCETLAMTDRFLADPNLPPKFRERVERIRDYAREQLEVDQRGSEP